MWKRLKQIGQATLFIGFSVIGLALLASEEPDQRLAGIAALLFFGGGGAMVYLVRWRSARPQPGLRAARVTFRGNPRPAFVADADRLMLLFALGGLVAMGGAGVLMMWQSGTDAIIAIGFAILLGGVLLYVLAGVLISSRVALVRDGILSTSAIGALLVEWSNIEGIAMFAQAGSPVLGVRLRDPAAVGAGPLQRLMMSIQRSLTGSDLAFPLSSYGVQPGELLAAIDRYIDQPAARGRIGDAGELSEIQATEAALQAQHPAVEPAPDADRAPLRLTLATGVVIVIGALLALIAVLAMLDADVAPDRRSSRVLGGVVFLVVAGAMLIGGVLMAKRASIGRWIAALGALGLTALLLIATVRSTANGGLVGVAVTALGLVLAAFVTWAAFTSRGWFARSARGTQ